VRCRREQDWKKLKAQSMTTATLDYPSTIRIEDVPKPKVRSAAFEPNFGPEDMHAIKAIAFIMNAIFVIALVMYSAITLWAWLES
jgi:hypothetical protein